jgi:hypothetical protein
MRKGIIAWIKSMASGITHFNVVLKPGQLTDSQRKECFGACTECPFQNGLKLELRANNPLDPSLRARTHCSLIEAWVTPILLEASFEDCPRRIHIANKQMASTRPLELSMMGK